MPSFQVFCLKYKFGILISQRQFSQILSLEDKSKKRKRSQRSSQIKLKNIEPEVTQTPSHLFHWTTQISQSLPQDPLIKQLKYGIFLKKHACIPPHTTKHRLKRFSGALWMFQFSSLLAEITKSLFWIQDFQMIRSSTTLPTAKKSRGSFFTI